VTRRAAEAGRSDRSIGKAEWLRSGPPARVLDILQRDGEEARVVGGAVRNTLLGLPPGEIIDIATTALPAEVISRVEAAGLKAVPTGLDHGTVTVVVDGKPVEVTTLREDVETFGRKANVRFGRNWRADAERRDFTMNALFAGADGTVYDYVGGLDDLAARRVRFIGNPATRIAEDYLRILRFFRFHAAYGSGAPDADALQACIAGRAGLEHLSRERVRMELLKLIVAEGVVPALIAMADAGLLVMVLGGVPQIPHLARMAEIEAALGLAPDPVRRLGALAVLIPEDADRLFERLRLTNVEHERLASVGDGWWRLSSAMEEQGARALLYRLGPERFGDRILLAWARSGAAASDAAWRGLASLPQRWTAPPFPLKAGDLIERGVAKGPALGMALRAAEEAWIAQGFPADDSTIAVIADEAARSAAVR
jgi:poly(A) polymerase